MGVLDITELAIEIVASFIFQIVPEKWMIMSFNIIIGMFVRLLYFFVEFGLQDIMKLEVEQLYVFALIWTFFYLYVVVVESKFIFKGKSYTSCREFWYKIMDIFSTYFALSQVVLNGEDFYGLTIFQTLIILIIINLALSGLELLLLSCLVCWAKCKVEWCQKRESQNFEFIGGSTHFLGGHLFGIAISIGLLVITFLQNKKEDNSIINHYIPALMGCEGILFLIICYQFKHVSTSEDLNSKFHNRMKKILCFFFGLSCGIFSIFIAHVILFFYLISLFIKLICLDNKCITSCCCFGQCLGCLICIDDSHINFTRVASTDGS